MSLALVTNEKNVLKGLFSSPESLSRFDRNYFLSSEGQDIYEALLDVVESGLSVSPENVYVKSAIRNPAITRDNVESLFALSVDRDDFIGHFRILREEYAKSRLTGRILNDLTKELTSKGKLNLEALEGLAYDLREHMDLVRGIENELVTPEQMAVKYMTEFDKRISGSSKFPSGLPFLDRALTVGFSPGEITTVFGATGVGKSTLALNMIQGQISLHIPSLYLSLEMSDIATMDRFIAMRNRIPVNWLYSDHNGSLDGYRALIASEREKLAQHNKFLYSDKASLSLEDVRSKIIEAQSRMKCRYMVVTVDLFTMLKDLSGEDPAAYEKAIDRLHRIARELGVHIVIVVQANRKADENRPLSIDQLDRLRPSIGHIKNANAIAERSRIVLGVFRAKYYARRLFPDDPAVNLMDDVMEVQVLKQSSGEVGQLVRFLHHEGTFRLTPFFQEAPPAA